MDVHPNPCQPQTRSQEPRRARNPGTSSTAAPSLQESHQHSRYCHHIFPHSCGYLEQSGSVMDPFLGLSDPNILSDINTIHLVESYFVSYHW